MSRALGGSRSTSHVTKSIGEKLAGNRVSCRLKGLFQSRRSFLS